MKRITVISGIKNNRRLKSRDLMAESDRLEELLGQISGLKRGKTEVFSQSSMGYHLHTRYHAPDLDAIETASQTPPIQDPFTKKSTIVIPSGSREINGIVGAIEEFYNNEGYVVFTSQI